VRIQETEIERLLRNKPANKAIICAPEYIRIARVGLQKGLTEKAGPENEGPKKNKRCQYMIRKCGVENAGQVLGQQL